MPRICVERSHSLSRNLPAETAPCSASWPPTEEVLGRSPSSPPQEGVFVSTRDPNVDVRRGAYWRGHRGPSTLADGAPPTQTGGMANMTRRITETAVLFAMLYAARRYYRK